jgi:predicted nucleic acid-binding protein
MGLMVDTNVFIRFEKRDKPIDFSAWESSQRVYISAVIVSELLMGVDRADTEERRQRERLGLLEVCRLQRRHAAAARLYADAFTADPKLPDDMKAEHRYDAACFAALAAAGQRTDGDKLDNQERRRLRQQALAWLRADLEQWSKRLEGGKPEDRQIVRAKLEHWQRDTDLAGVRGPQALKKLPAQEQEAWRKLWDDVAESHE